MPWRACLLFAAVAALAAISVVPMSGYDTDFFWHLAAGRHMWQNGQLLTQDVFSHTRAGQAWANRDWLFQMVLYPVYHLGGLNAALGLRILTTMLSLAVLATTARLRGAGRAATILAVFWGGSLAAHYPLVRPFMFSLLCASLELLALEKMRQRGRPDGWPLALLLGSLWIWSNMHGGVSLVGLAMVCLHALAGRPRRPWWRLCVLAAISVLAIPQPVETVEFVVNMMLGNNPYKHIIIEFFPPDWLAPHELPYLAFILVYFVGSLVRARRGQWLELGLLLTFAPLLFTGGRHQFLMVPLLTPGLAVMLTDWAPRPRVTWLVALLSLALGLRCAVLAVRVGWPPQRLLAWQELPEGACRFLLANDLRGNLFNDMPWGGYLMWRLFPHCKVFFDARNEVYPDGPFLRDFLQLRRTGQPLEMLDRYAVDYLVLSTHEAGPISASLAGSRAWKRVYDDGVANVYLRADRDFTPVPAPPYWTERWQQGRQRQSIGELQAALRENPDCAELRVELGVLLAPTQLNWAEHHWRLALLAGPVRLAHYNLGVAAQSRGQLRQAAFEFWQELALGDSPQARERLARLPRLSTPEYAIRWAWEWFRAPFRL